MYNCFCNIIMTGESTHILHQKEEGHLTKYVWSHAPTINYEAKMEAAIALHVQLCFFHYTVQYCKQRTAREVSQLSIIFQWKY